MYWSYQPCRCPRSRKNQGRSGLAIGVQFCRRRWTAPVPVSPPVTSRSHSSSRRRAHTQLRPRRQRSPTEVLVSVGVAPPASGGTPSRPAASVGRLVDALGPPRRRNTALFCASQAMSVTGLRPVFRASVQVCPPSVERYTPNVWPVRPSAWPRRKSLREPSNDWPGRPGCAKNCRPQRTPRRDRRLQPATRCARHPTISECPRRSNCPPKNSLHRYPHRWWRAWSMCPGRCAPTARLCDAITDRRVDGTCVPRALVDFQTPP